MWEIKQDSRGQWYWQQTTREGTHRVSAGVFATREAALQNAVAHGYPPAPASGSQPHGKEQQRRDLM